MPKRYFSIFSRQAEDHLASLRSRLLSLERVPTPSALHELVTLAHSLKGSALMVGVADIAAIANQLEEHLKGMAAGRSPVNAAAIEFVGRGLDVIGMLTTALSRDEQPALDVSQFIEEYGRRGKAEADLIALQPVAGGVAQRGTAAHETAVLQACGNS